MSIKPILFNTEMVKAILDGRKTQTRRPMKIQPPADDYHLCSRITNSSKCIHFWGVTQNGVLVKEWTKYFEKPYSIGDVLYVRETWARLSDYKGIDPGFSAMCAGCFYKTEYPYGLWYEVTGDAGHDKKVCWRPSIHMPKWAARLFLEITDVRAERVQEIEDRYKTDDVLAEGYRDCGQCGGVGYYEGGGDTHDCRCCDCGQTDMATKDFKEAWDSIYAKKGLGWELNPWAFAYTFKVIDKPEGAI